MGGSFDIDHDRFVRKNRDLASAYSKDDKERMSRRTAQTGETAHKPSCFNCKKRTKCPEFRRNREGSSSGAVSFGGGNDAVICDQYEAEKTQEKPKGMSDKKVKSLLKNMKKKF